ncbi:hypothetical protein SAMN05216429_11282 [Marinobacter persicus]|uniref:Uncharacterized protein n=1 Tax=Marinobacter persicus TaxID=930118 RepID=A0A1I3XQ60_9GAMM|nr:hypothetical protein GCM10008110_19650 [Marinobacter persicus]SFK21672.1 hypothetical protein SAMN05216429_11282 [Marinobacter persicus]
MGVTKLWIDVLMRNVDNEIVGMVGTGMNLDDFLQDIVDIGQDGITTLFVDYNGAIQLYRDRWRFSWPPGRRRHPVPGGTLAESGRSSLRPSRSLGRGRIRGYPLPV